MKRYRDKYRSETIRARFWNYGWNGAYFVTISTKGHQCWFGEVREKVIRLSGLGHIANSCWLEIPKHFPFVRLGGHVVMPNHVHGIVYINKSVATQNLASPPKIHKFPGNAFGPQSQNLASIIRGFKAGVTKFGRPINQQFQWQSRYYDHIIRDERCFNYIDWYIKNNPAIWKTDKFYVDESSGKNMPNYTIGK